MHHSNPLSRKNQVLDPFCQEKSQVLYLACQEVTKSWLYSAQSDPRLGHSPGRETQYLGFLWAENPKSWFFSVNRNPRDRLWTVLLAALYLTWSDSESGPRPRLIFFLNQAWWSLGIQYGIPKKINMSLKKLTLYTFLYLTISVQEYAKWNFCLRQKIQLPLALLPPIFVFVRRNLGSKIWLTFRWKKKR